MMHRDTTNEMDGLRFRFRATSLPKSPSAEHITSRHAIENNNNNNNEEDDDDYSDDDVVLATYVEPPELPTKTTHKVFGAFLSLLFSDEMRLLSLPFNNTQEQRERRRITIPRVYMYIYI